MPFCNAGAGTSVTSTVVGPIAPVVSVFGVSQIIVSRLRNRSQPVTETNLPRLVVIEVQAA